MNDEIRATIELTAERTAEKVFEKMLKLHIAQCPARRALTNILAVGGFLMSLAAIAAVVWRG